MSRIATLEKALEEQAMGALRQADTEDSGQSRPNSFTNVTYPDFPSLYLTDVSPHNSELSLQSPSSQNSCYSSPEPLSQEDDSGPLLAITPLTHSTYETASSLAQLSVSHHGEYLGRGTSLSALHSVCCRFNDQS